VQVRLLTLNLLQALEEWRPECIVHAKGNKGNSVTVFRLGFDELDEKTFLTFLQNLLGTRGEEKAYIISLENIDIISPSAAKALVSAAISTATQYKVPILLTKVNKEALYGLQTVRNTQSTEHVLWAIDGEGSKHLIGALPDRLQDILNVLRSKGASSASDLVEYNKEETSKKNINRYSVYLQELYNTGLVLREKIIGSIRTDSERGWTYVYRPAYDVLSLSSL